MKPHNFQSIALDHCSRYPELLVEDLYKLVHQSALGSEHAVEEISRARQRLLREIEQLTTTSAEPLIDVISPDRSVVRVYLKPYMDSGRIPENLLLAFIRTANEFNGSMDFLMGYWKDIQDLAQRGEIPFLVGNLKSFIDRMGSLGFPAVHHSAQYKQAYHPFYRVIANEHLEICIANLNSFS